MKNQKGFTLIELLLVLAIIGIISAIAIPALLGQRERAKMQATKDNTVNIVADLQSTLDALSDPPSERRTGLPTTDYKGDMNAMAYAAIDTVAGTGTTYAQAKNPYNNGTVYVLHTAAASSAAGTAGNVYLDDTGVNASTGGNITVTGNFRDAKGNYQQLVKQVAVN